MAKDDKLLTFSSKRDIIYVLQMKGEYDASGKFQEKNEKASR